MSDEATRNVSATDMPAVDIEGFFYIKGSKDYPKNQPIDKPFGYDFYGNTVTEQPIFQSSIRDIYINKKDLVELSNNYSGESDDGNLIGAAKENTFNAKSIRFDRSEEYISTLIFKRPGVTTDPSTGEDNVPESIAAFMNALSPNYTLTNGNVGEISSEKPYNGNNSYSYVITNNKRYNVFWQKVLTFLEFIKKHEREIYLNYGNNSLSSGTEGIGGIQLYPLNEVAENYQVWYENPNAFTNIMTAFGNGNIFQKILWMYFLTPNSMRVPGNGLGASSPSTVSLKEGYTWNPFSAKFINAALGNAPSQIGNTADSNLSAAIKIDQLNSRSGYYDQDTVGISINPNVTPTEFSSANIKFGSSGRIDYIQFKLTFAATEYVSEQSNLQTVNFKIFFNPDAFVNDGNSSSTLPVWTYNDLNFDNDLRRKYGGPKYEYPITHPKWNKYDNDYANVLLPKVSDQEFTIRGKFVVSDKLSSDDSNNTVPENEIQQQFVAKLIEQIQSGGYSKYTTFSTTRYSPFISDDGTRIEWETKDETGARTLDNAVQQIFYVFYKTTPPTPNEIKESVKAYLRNLHKDCSNTSYVKETNPPKIATIGHGTDPGELNNFLSKMYPELFKQSEISIVPLHYDEVGEVNGIKQYGDASKYFTTITPKRIIKTFSEGPNELKDYGLPFDGNSSANAMAGNGKYPWPMEAIYIGSIVGDANNYEPTFQFGFPWFAISKSLTDGNSGNVLTNLPGFGNYKQEFFNSAALQDPTPAQRLELILIKLAQNMFTQIGHTTGGSDINHKPRYDRLFNVSIQYETDTSFDSTINPSTTDGIRYYNKAIFVLNSVEFTVYAQKGKNFGSEVSRSVDENEKPL